MYVSLKLQFKGGDTNNLDVFIDFLRAGGGRSLRTDKVYLKLGKTGKCIYKTVNCYSWRSEDKFYNFVFITIEDSLVAQRGTVRVKWIWSVIYLGVSKSARNKAFEKITCVLVYIKDLSLCNVMKRVLLCCSGVCQTNELFCHVQSISSVFSFPSFPPFLSTTFLNFATSRNCAFKKFLNISFYLSYHCLLKNIPQKYQQCQ